MQKLKLFIFVSFSLLFGQYDYSLEDINSNSESFEELTNNVNQIIEQLEKEKNLENSIDSYQKLIKLNNIIEKKFQIKSKEINKITKEKIKKIVRSK